MTEKIRFLNAVQKSYERFDAGILKIVACVAMFIDHLTHIFLAMFAPGTAYSAVYDIANGMTIYELGRGIGRSAFPIFAFLIVEGYCHTRNRIRYLLQILAAAVLAYYPYSWALVDFYEEPVFDTLFTFAYAVVAMWVIDEVLLHYLGRNAWQSRAAKASSNAKAFSNEKIAATAKVFPDGKTLFTEESVSLKEHTNMSAPYLQDKKSTRIYQIAVRFLLSAAVVAFICYLAEQVTPCDYGMAGILLVLIFFLLRDFRLGGVLLGYVCLVIRATSEVMAFPGMILILLYNGKRGRQLKYFFYLFYPLHLLLIFALRRILWGY